MTSDMISYTKRLTFCAGHRVFVRGHECEHLHGHNYVVHATGFALPNPVTDFSTIKQRLGQWLGEKWDGGFIYFDQDDQMRLVFEHNNGLKWFALPTNPTAENLAAYLLREVCPMLFADTQITITKIRVHETEDCYADASL